MLEQSSENPGGSKEQEIRREESVASTPAPTRDEAILSAISAALQSIDAKAARIETVVSKKQDDHLFDLMICTLIDLRAVEHCHKTIADLANRISGAIYNVGGFDEIAPEHLAEFNPALHRPSQETYPTGNCQYNGRVRRTKRIGIRKDNRAFKRFAAEVELYRFQAPLAKAPPKSGGSLFASSNQPQAGVQL